MDNRPDDGFIAGMNSVPDTNRTLAAHAATLVDTAPTVSSITICVEFSNGTGAELHARLTCARDLQSRMM